jgi:hypothetical protein
MARTPRQKLEARGEKITPASIRQNLQDSVNTPAGRKAASVAAELVNVVGRVVLFFVKLVAAVIGFSLLLSAAGIITGMLIVLFEPHSAFVSNGVSFWTVFDGMATPVLFVLLVLFCAMIPLFVMGMALLSLAFSWRLGRLFYALTLGSWVFAIFFCGFVAAKEAGFLRDELPERMEQWVDRQDRHRHHRHRYDGGEWREGEGGLTDSLRARDSLDTSVPLDTLDTPDTPDTLDTPDSSEI